jgi:Ca2+-binding RTX toxin-like protein
VNKGGEMNENDLIEYQGKKVVVKSIPSSGENLSVFVRPGDEVDFNLEDFDLDLLEYQLIGGDIVVQFPDGGIITFASMALMGYSQTPPVLNFGTSGKSVSVDDILSVIEEVNELPIESVNASFRVRVSDNEEETGVMNKVQETPQAPVIIIVESNNYDQPYQEPETEKFTYQESVQTDNISPVIPTENFFTGYYVRPENNYTGYLPYEKPGEVEDAAKPAFYFKATAHQVKQTEPFYNEEGFLEVQGGGGSLNGYTFDSVTNQYEPETIDMSAQSENMVIKAENATYFSDTPEDSPTYLSRVLRFEPQMPEGFYVDSFTLQGLPQGVAIFDRYDNEITGETISKDGMLFKDALGNVIEFNDDDFLTLFKTAEFTIRYESDVAESFDIAIRANYKVDEEYLDTIDINPNQSYTNDYTVVLKDITSADDYTYDKNDYVGAKEEGFIFAKEPNSNIIKLGSGDTTVYGGNVKDVVYIGEGDDTVYGGDGTDTIYGGAGQNYIYGDTYFDVNGDAQNAGSERNLISYAQVQSYSLTQLKLLRDEGKLSNQEYAMLTGSYVPLDDDGNETTNTLDVDMLAYYKGVYVDLNGFTDEESLWVDENENEIVDDEEKINALSKFAQSEGTFTYNDDGDAVSTTLTQSGLSNLQSNGYDRFFDIDDVEGSNFNDTIYGNDASNIISGLQGSDILDGRGGGDTLFGGEGYDTLFSGSGDDYIDGGEDTDTVNYQNANGGVVVRLDKPNGDEYDDFATGHGNDTLFNIEDVIGSNYGDTIFGSGGTNYLMGMDGDDSFFAGKGYDFIDGGDGSDWISYYLPDYPDRVTNDGYMENIQGITVSMGNDFVMLKETSTGRLIDLIKDIEQVSGTYGVDTIWGDSSDEVFWGHEGNDNLRGWNGNDTLYGGDDDDYILPGRGVDYSDGGDGIDFLDLHREDTLRNKTVQRLRIDEDGTVQHSTDGGNTWIDGYLSNDGLETAVNFEGMRGDDSDDYIIGNSQDNRLEGYNGDDDIYGLGGDDFIRGGNGDDSIFAGDGNDTIYGDANNDYIEAGDGDDLIYGHSVHNKNQTNKDTIDGGEGNDTINYSSSRYGFELTLNGSNDATVDFTGSLPTSHSQNNTGDANAFDDTIRNIENVVGSRANDIITGDDNANILDGWHGKDTISGGGGDDTIIARNTSGETLDGGEGTDTLQLAQNVNFRNQTIENFEILDLGSNRAYFNAEQFFEDNAFSEIIGDENSILYLYGTGGTDSFDFSNMDFSGFEGTIYSWAYGDDDSFDFDGTDFDDNDVDLRLDGSSGTDSLHLGDNQTLTMTENYYNTFETFDVGITSVLNVEALNNGGRSFYAHNKNFDAVLGEINYIGGSGNDNFYLDFSALREGKLSVDGGDGIDTVDIRTSLSGETLTFNDANAFNNIERLDIDYSSTRNNDIEFFADVMQSWLGGADELTLDIANNTQGSRVSIDTHNGTITDLSVGASYSVQVDADETFTLHVV